MSQETHPISGNQNLKKKEQTPRGGSIRLASKPHLADQVTLGIQALLLDLHRLGKRKTRYKNSTAVARSLMSKKGFEDVLKSEEHPVQFRPLYTPTHRGRQRMIYEPGITDIYDGVDQYDGEVYKYAERQAASYLPLKLKAEGMMDTVQQVKRLGMAAFVDELDPYDDWETLYKSTGRISWIAAIEHYLLNRI